MFLEKGWMIPAVQFGPGDVFVIEDWDETPAGPYGAIFHFDPEGRRTLYASTSGGTEILSGIHRFDERYEVDMDMRRSDGKWTIEADTGDRGMLSMEVSYAETPVLKVLNPISCRMPGAIAGSTLYCTVIPRLAGPLLGINPKQKIAGRTELGTKSRFQLNKLYKVGGGRCSWGDSELGPPRDCLLEHDLGDFSFTPPMKPIVSDLTLFVG